MKRNILRTAAGCLAAAAVLSVTVSARPNVSAQSAILLDGTTGRVLYEQNADARAKVASTTKIMTGLLVAEECDLSASVCVPGEAAGVEGSSLYLKAGEVLTVEALLYGLMLHSGNDAAVALAMYCAGSVPAFAERMNRRAEELGLTNTNYVNPHGLDAENHYSTARDLAKLAAAAMENDVFYKVVSTKTAVFGNRTFTNHNKLLWRYEGTVGVKTGYTMSAGRILVSAAEKNGRRLIAVTIRDRNDWADHMAMLDYGFSDYASREVARSGQIFGKVPVINGAEESVQAVVQEDVFWCMAKEEQAELRPNLPIFIYAPVLAGEKAGTLSVLVDGKEVKQVPLYWRYSVLEEG